MNLFPKILSTFKSSKGENAEQNTSAPSSQIKFSDMELNAALLKNIELAGYKTPTPIQALAIPLLLQGRDILGTAQTGTGKTAAFLLPILHTLLSHSGPKRPLSVLVLAPTRELAIQIGENFEQYAQHTKIRSTVIFGGVSQRPQEISLSHKPDVVIATPGRLLDLIEQGHIKLDGVQHLVLDEADRMLDMGFLPSVKRIMKLVPHARQTALFSATMPSDVLKFANSILSNPERVSVAPVAAVAAKIDEFVYMVPSQKNKSALLLHLIAEKAIERGIVFTRTKHIANRVSDFLLKNKVPSAAIHSNKSQNARQRALSDFKEGKVHILVASDIASRGIDVDEITHVFNFDLPNVPETYVHRIGRTGRASASGIAISFCSPEEIQHLKAIERTTRKKIPVVSEHPFLEPLPSNAPAPSTHKPNANNNQHRHRRPTRSQPQKRQR